MNNVRVLTVNVGQETPNPYKRSGTTGIHKRPVEGLVTINAPGDGGSGVGDDYIGDSENHGGADQAVYAFQREDLDRWEQIKGREFPNGAFGENLTTEGIEANNAIIGEQWRIGDSVVLEITGPRIPCSTFRGVIGDPTWLKQFTQDARPGAYFRVIRAGQIAGGDPIEVIHRPPHDVTVRDAFLAITTDKSLVAKLRAAAEYLPPDLVEYASSAVPDTD